MILKILLLVSVCAAYKKDKEFDMLVRLDPRTCPEFPLKCRLGCTRLNFQIGFCNSHHQCVCVKESRRDAFVNLHTKETTKEEKHDVLDAHVTYFLARMLSLGVRPQTVMQSIKGNPLYRRMSEATKEYSNGEGESDDGVNEVRNHTFRLKAEIAPTMATKSKVDDEASKTDWSFSSKQSPLDNTIPTTKEEPTKMSGKLEASKTTENGRSDTKYGERTTEELSVNNDARRYGIDKGKQANGQSIERVRIFLYPVPTYGDDVNLNTKRVPGAYASVRSLQEKFLSLLLSHAKNANENAKTEQTAKQIVFNKSGAQGIENEEKTNPVSPPEENQQQASKMETARIENPTLNAVGPSLQPAPTETQKLPNVEGNAIVQPPRLTKRKTSKTQNTGEMLRIVRIKRFADNSDIENINSMEDIEYENSMEDEEEFE